MPRGGRRPGAGRPKGIHTKLRSTLDKEAAAEALRAVVKDHMERMVSAQIEHACGLKFLVYRDSKTGKFVKVTADANLKLLQERNTIEVWDKDPSTQAFTDLMNRTLGKPAEQVEMNANVSGTINLEARIKAGRDRLVKAKKG